MNHSSLDNDPAGSSSLHDFGRTKLLSTMKDSMDIKRQKGVQSRQKNNLECRTTVNIAMQRSRLAGGGGGADNDNAYKKIDEFISDDEEDSGSGDGGHSIGK